MIELRAPHRPLWPLEHPSVFLGGAIDNGKTVNWQAEAISVFSLASDELIFLNPRRENWDAGAGEQAIISQIHWEEDALSVADSILIYFEPSSQAPISLLEMGLWANSGKLVVCCPRAYWRSTNVHVTAKSHGIYLYEDLHLALGKAADLAVHRFYQ